MVSLLRDMGNPGRFQVLIWLMLLSIEIPLAMNNISMVFYGYGAVPDCDSRTTANSSGQEIWNDTFPVTHAQNSSDDETLTDLAREVQPNYLLDEREWTIVAEVNLILFVLPPK